MAENKTKQTKVSVASFIDALPNEEKRTDAKVLVKMMERATGEKAAMWGPTIIGFGSYHYVYESGREGDMPVIGFSPRKPALVLYMMTQFDGAKELLQRLGKQNTEGGCTYVKRLADVDLEILESLIKKSVAARRKQYPPKSRP